MHFEDGDQGPALRALTPHLQWTTAPDGADVLPYVDFLDIAGRPLVINSVPKLDTAIYQLQVSATPLSRSWQLMLPGMGLEPGTAGAPSTLSRRKLRSRLELCPHQVCAIWISNDVRDASLQSNPQNTPPASLQ